MASADGCVRQRPDVVNCQLSTTLLTPRTRSVAVPGLIMGSATAEYDYRPGAVCGSAVCYGLTRNAVSRPAATGRPAVSPWPVVIFCSCLAVAFCSLHFAVSGAPSCWRPRARPITL
jgi:hypothetical protein